MKAFQTPESCYFPSSYHPSVWKPATFRAGLGYDWASREWHRLSLRKLQKSLIHCFEAVALAGACWQTDSALAARSSQLAAHRSRRLPAGEEILNEGKTYTRQTHTHTHKHIRCRQEPSVKVVGMRLLLFITIPKPGLNFQSAFRKVSGSREKKQRGC